MATSAKFVADFQDFNGAVDDAVVKLRTFQDGIGRVDKDLARFGDQFSGTRLIQDATLMVEAVERVGGVSKLTEAEMARLANTVAAASEKMRAMGIEVPPEFSKITDETMKMDKAFDDMDASIVTVDRSTVQATNSFGGLTNQLGAVDKTLGLLGVQMGPQIQALRELSEASRVGSEGLGLLSKAGLVAATAFAAWKIGEWISDFTGMEKALGDSLPVLLGWTDVTGDAEYRVNQLSKASEIAGRAITDVTEAAKIQADEIKRLADEHETAAKAQVAAIQKTLEAYRAAREQLREFAQEQQSFSNSLAGFDAVSTAQQYLTALQSLHDDGLVPLKSKHEEIVDVMEQAKIAMQNLGLTGTQAYRDIIATIDQFTAKVLESSRIPGAANLIHGPGAVGGPGTTTADVNAGAAQAGMESWAAQVAEDVRELDAEVEKYHQMQTKVLDDAATGADRASESVRALHESFQLLTGSIQMTGAELEKAYRDAGVFVHGGTAAVSGAFNFDTQNRRQHPSSMGGPGMSVMVDARGGFFETASDTQRLGNRVGDALMSRVR